MDWEISNLARQCSGCEHAFAEEDEVFSGLCDEKTAFVRRDYCEACWGRMDCAEFYSNWRTRMPKKDETPKRFVDDDVLLNFFYRLEGEEEELKVNFRYVLALLLIRKKLLKFKSLRREGEQEWLILFDRREDRNHEVLNPDLAAEQLTSVTEECGKLLNIKL